MNILTHIANICVLLGAISLLGAVIVKIFHIRMLGLVPFSFFCFADTCLLMGIALYIREILVKGETKKI